jgi:hypothetical protein
MWIAPADLERALRLKKGETATLVCRVKREEKRYPDGYVAPAVNEVVRVRVEREGDGLALFYLGASGPRERPQDASSPAIVVELATAREVARKLSCSGAPGCPHCAALSEIARIEFECDMRDGRRP